jgi:hypothetical protein
MDYASDEKCHNSEPGTFGHECGKPAVWIGKLYNANFRSGFCQNCRDHGAEAAQFGEWVSVGAKAASNGWDQVEA